MADFFRIEDENSAVRALQRRLRTLAAWDARIPVIFIDGIYGTETEEAVMAFQKAYELPVTGDVDFETHKAIDDAYRLRVLSLEQRSGTPDFDRMEGRVISPGDRSGAVTALQALFRSIAEQDERFSVSLSGVYDPDTLRAVIFFAGLRGRESDGKVDRVFWNELSDFASRPSEN